MAQYVLLGVLIFLSVLNLALLVALGSFIVSFRQRTNAMFSDILDVFEQLFGAIPVSPTVESTGEKKTWDEKYEDELEALQRRIRAESGLKDLPDPGLSWGEPPAPNQQNAEGLTILKDK